MHKTTKVIVESVKEVVTELICNQCGKTVFKNSVPIRMSGSEDYPQSDMADENGLYVEMDCTYGASFNEGDHFNFYICEPCVFDLVQSFAIKPKIQNHYCEPVEKEEEYG